MEVCFIIDIISSFFIMSETELLKIQKTLLNLPLEQLEDFLLELASKIYQKKKKQKIKGQNIPSRDATEEEVELIQEGLDSGFLSVKESRDFLEEVGFYK
jgi:hypothetical protein